MNQELQRIDQPVAVRQTQALDSVGRKAAIDDLLNKVALVQEVMTKVMHEGEHWGKVPGCGDKPALLKAGAEKLGMTFRLQPRFDVSERDLGGGHREYSITCTLSDGTQGVGSCTTMETKYRYRQGERKCPECGKASIIVGKKEFGGGFLCFTKKGGCGAKFQENDERITGQQVGKVEHDNPADYWNTCLKMGKKRAHVDAIITATACSDIFTQDVEEMVSAADAPTTTPAAHQASPPTQETPRTAPKTAQVKAEGKEVVLPSCHVEMVSERQGNSNGKPWTLYTVLLTDGHDRVEASTFSKVLGGAAEQLSKDNIVCVAKIKPGRKEGTKELVEIFAMEGAVPASQPEDDLPFENVPLGVTP